MSNLAFMGQSPEKIGPVVEEKLKKELGLSEPIPYKVEDQNISKVTVGTMLGDLASTLFGGSTNLLFTLSFSLEKPRQALIRLDVARQGIGSRGETIIYSTILNKKINGEVMLEAPRTFGASKFSGDQAACGKLNSNGNLLKRAGLFSRTQAEIGGNLITISRYFRIIPKDNGSELTVVTLPKMVSMGFNALLDAKEFFDITSMIEQIL